MYIATVMTWLLSGDSNVHVHAAQNQTLLLHVKFSKNLHKGGGEGSDTRLCDACINVSYVQDQ